MQIKIERIFDRWLPSERRGYCIGRLFVDGEYFCDTLEPYDLGHTMMTDKSEIERQKKVCPCAIATGTYMVAMHIWSHKFGPQEFYRDTCSGFLPRLMGVPGRDGILIHAGNTTQDTTGCILVGINDKAGLLSDSRYTFQMLYSKMKAAARNYEGIKVSVTRIYPD